MTKIKPSRFKKSNRSAFLCPAVSSLAWLLCPFCCAQGNTNALPRSGGSANSSNVPSTINSPLNKTEPLPDERLESLRARGRADDRQKRMVEDASRLVALTARYRAHVSEHGRETTEDARLLLDIEKLARSVKDRMRGM